MQFPLIGSAVLFGLYVVVKFVSKDYLDILISCYFALLGTGGLFSAAQPPLTELAGASTWHTWSFSIDYQKWKRRENREPLDFSFNALDVGLALVSACTAGAAHVEHAQGPAEAAAAAAAAAAAEWQMR